MCEAKVNGPRLPLAILKITINPTDVHAVAMLKEGQVVGPYNLAPTHTVEVNKLLEGGMADPHLTGLSIMLRSAWSIFTTN